MSKQAKYILPLTYVNCVRPLKCPLGKYIGKWDSTYIIFTIYDTVPSVTEHSDRLWSADNFSLLHHCLLCIEFHYEGRRDGEE